MSKLRSLASLAVPLCLAGAMMTSSCQDDLSQNGGSLVTGEVNILVDSDFVVKGRSLRQADMDARSNIMLLGKINIAGYGRLNTSFVTQLLSAGSMNISDTIPVDSVSGMKFKLHYRRGALTGDSLTPCQLKVFQLTKQLPADIASSFDPTGYYDPSKPLGKHNYTASMLGSKDSVFYKDLVGHVTVDMPLSLAKNIFNQYRKDPSVFQWPANFNKYFPGLYIENTFGSGCVVNMSVGEMTMYYKTRRMVTQTKDSVSTRVPVAHTDSVTLFATAPEVLSSNNLTYEPDPELQRRAETGEPLIVSPCGYYTEITLPLQEILDKYWSNDFNLAVINNLLFTLPADKIENEYKLAPAPYLLMVRKVDFESFFAENRVPDNTKKSFWASYDSSRGLYTFTSMREMIVDLMKTGQEVPQEDMEFILVPVEISTQLVNQNYQVTACTPYLNRPTLAAPKLDKAKLQFIFSLTK